MDSPSLLIPFKIISFILLFVNAVLPASVIFWALTVQAMQPCHVIGLFFFFLQQYQKSKLNEETPSNYLDAIVA